MKLHLPPDGSVLVSFASAKQQWWRVLAEWYDNALDAGAHAVSIDVGKDFIHIADDGQGCAEPPVMVRLGAHAKQDSTRLGRFGVGGKHAGLWVGGPDIDSMVAIKTVHRGILRTFQINWADYGKTWDLESPHQRQARPDEHGTSITVTRARSLPHGHQWSKLLDDLGYFFAPAIRLKRQLRIRRPGEEWHALVAWEPPPWVGDIIDRRVVIHGRGARVRCGIVEGPNPRYGFTYIHEWRVIIPAGGTDNSGCNGYNPGHICGIVDLDATWGLTANKDGLSEDDAVDLYAAVAQVCEPLLRRADKLGVELSHRDFETEVNAQLNALPAIDLPRKKERRHKGNSHGTHDPAGTGKKREHAEKTKPETGSVIDKQRGAGYRVMFADFGTADEAGKLSGRFIMLNQANPYVSAARKAQNAQAIVGLASAVLAITHSSGRQGVLRDVLPGPTPEDFSEILGRILALLLMDGEPVAT